VIPKIKKLRDMVDKRGLDIEIEVDGGIGPETIATVSSAGANVFVAGSAIYHSDDYEKTIRLMRERIVP
jgi:ribulose-phosphate 3-epimerase